jgi:hypothetical protein
MSFWPLVSFNAISGAAPAFAPDDIAGLEAWFEADAGITESGGLVSVWANQATSGSNRDLVQSTGASKPTYTASDSDFNNEPSLSSSDGWRLMTSASTWSSSVAQPMTFFIVMKGTGAGTGGYIDTYATGRCGLLSDGGVFETYYGGSYPTHSTTSGTHLVWFTANGASSEIGIDALAGVGASNGTTGLDGLTILSTTGAANPAATGTKIAALLIYSSALGSSDRGDVLDYLSTKYGVSYTP